MALTPADLQEIAKIVSMTRDGKLPPQLLGTVLVTTVTNSALDGLPSGTIIPSNPNRVGLLVLPGQGGAIYLWPSGGDPTFGVLQIGVSDSQQWLWLNTWLHGTVVQLEWTAAQQNGVATFSYLEMTYEPKS